MISSEAQRKLVKSPPELWAELSDPVALSRHLGGLGEIRITHAEPERSLEWEAEAARGKVELRPSGWGTQVTLTIARELPRAKDDPHKSKLAQEAEPEPAKPAEPALPAETAQTAQEVIEPAQEGPAPRRGFFAQLFRRRSRVETPPTGETPALAETPAPAETPTTEEPSIVVLDTPISAKPPTTVETPAAEPARSEPPAADEPTETDAKDPDADRAAAEGEIAAQTDELLTSVLDRLGAAHHRPFSRA